MNEKNQIDINQTNAQNVLIKFFSSKMILFLAIANCVIYLLSAIDSLIIFIDLLSTISIDSIDNILDFNEQYENVITISPVFPTLISIIVLFVMYGNAKKNTTKSFNGCFTTIKVFAIINIVLSSFSILSSLTITGNSLFGEGHTSIILNLLLMIGSILTLIINIFINKVVTYQKDHLATGIRSSEGIKPIAIPFIITGVLSIIAVLLSTEIRVGNLFASLLDVFIGVVVIQYGKEIGSIPTMLTADLNNNNPIIDYNQYQQ